MDILLANPRGFCAGVDRAIEIVERAIDLFGAPIYVRHEVVHNKYVVDGLKKIGAVFVEELDEIPDGATVIFSAHGVARVVQKNATDRGLKIFDATCPLVTKVHMEVRRHADKGIETLMIGHAGHPEVEGTLGQYNKHSHAKIQLVETIQDVGTLTVNNPEKLSYVTQTTLSVDETIDIITALKKRFPHIQGPKKDDICYATQNRQDEVKKLSTQCDLILVVGSQNSSNSNRLKELAEQKNTEAYLIDDADEIKTEWIENKKCIGVTAGASAPEELVRQVVAQLQKAGGQLLNGDESNKENITFVLPPALR